MITCPECRKEYPQDPPKVCPCGQSLDPKIVELNRLIGELGKMINRAKERWVLEADPERKAKLEKWYIRLLQISDQTFKALQLVAPLECADESELKRV